jgi:nicotinamidase-related amidase
MNRFGIFDVDSWELNETGDGLSPRPRVAPIVPKLQRLHAWAAIHNYPVVLTCCCSGRMLSPRGLPGILHVPLSPPLPSLEGFRQFYLAKKAYGDPKINFAQCAFDMFRDNTNAAQLVRALNVETWVVFGNGFDLCVNSAVRGILRAGQSLILLEDVRVSSANGTPASEQETLKRLRSLGAQVMTLEQFFAVETA